MMGICRVHIPTSLGPGVCVLALRITLDVEVVMSVAGAAGGLRVLLVIPRRTSGTCGIRGALHCCTDREGRLFYTAHTWLSRFGDQWPAASGCCDLRLKKPQTWSLPPKMTEAGLLPALLREIPHLSLPQYHPRSLKDKFCLGNMLLFEGFRIPFSHRAPAPFFPAQSALLLLFLPFLPGLSHILFTPS